MDKYEASLWRAVPPGIKNIMTLLFQTKEEVYIKDYISHSLIASKAKD